MLKTGSKETWTSEVTSLMVFPNANTFSVNFPCFACLFAPWKDKTQFISAEPQREYYVSV